MVSKFSDVAVVKSEEDKLGFKAYAEGIIASMERISEINTPFTIGIFGGWGSGKTSFLRIMESLLDSRGYQTLFFNSWDEEKPWIPFIIQVVDELFKKEGKKRLVKKEEIDIKKLIRNILLFSTDVVLQSYSQGKISTGEILDLIERSRKTSPYKVLLNEDPKIVIERVTKIKEFKDRLEEKVEELQKKKIIFFIDDLDKIPEKILDFLNNLRIFLDIRGCIFILNCDYKILERELKKRYGEEIYKDYLDKVIQIKFFIPSLSEQAIKAYLQFLTNWNGKELEECTQLVIHSVEGNPRKIKEVVNATMLTKDIFESRLVTFLQAFERPKTEEEIEEPMALKSEITRIFTPAKVFDILFDTKLLFKLMCMKKQWSSLFELILRKEKMQIALISLQDAVTTKDTSELLNVIFEKREILKEIDEKLPIFLKDSPRFYGVNDLKVYYNKYFSSL